MDPAKASALSRATSGPHSTPVQSGERSLFMVKAKKTKRHTQVTDLPKKQKELSKAEQKKVKGGDADIKANYFKRYPVAKELGSN
jgi:hypothetical protein